MPTAAKTPAAKAPAKAVPKGPSFKVTPIGDELPANPVRTRTVNREELIANLTAIMETPDTWFEIAEYAARAGTEEKPGGARKIVAKFLAGEIAPPDCEDGFGFLVEWRHANYNGSARKGSVVCARYGEVTDEE